MKRKRMDRRIGGWLRAATLALLLGCFASSGLCEDFDVQKPAPFVPIGAWFEGNPAYLGLSEGPRAYRDYLDRALGDIKKIGLNCVAVPNVPQDYERLLLEAAARNDLKVIMEVDAAKQLITEATTPMETFRETAQRIVTRHGYSDVLARYQIRDEPAPELMPAWLAMQTALVELDPIHPAFSCFNRPESLEMARDANALHEAVFDIYPLNVDTPNGEFSQYREKLDRFLQAAGPLPSWIVLQAFAKENVWRYPESVELRYMTYLALAKGVKGFFFFIYQTMPNHFERLQGLVDAELVPRPIYAECQRLSERLALMKDVILSLQPVEPFAHVPAGVDAGFYRCNEKSLCLILVNQDLKNPQYVPIRLNEQIRPKPDRFRDEATGESSEFHWTVGPPTTRVLLNPGEGTIVTFWRESEEN